MSIYPLFLFTFELLMAISTYL